MLSYRLDVFSPMWFSVGYKFLHLGSIYRVLSGDFPESVARAGVKPVAEELKRKRRMN